MSVAHALRRMALTVGILGCAGCGGAPPVTATGAPAPEGAPPAPAGAVREPAPGADLEPTATSDARARLAAGEPCGPLECRRFETTADAFAAVLAERPLVLAIGETHVPKGTKVRSTATRFIEELLPMLEGRARDLVLELWVVDPKCRKEQVAKVAAKAKEVTAGQSESNQGDFVRLGDESKRRGIQPHVLRPSCDEYDQIVAAGMGDIGRMLEMLAARTAAVVKERLEARRGEPDEPLVVAYGGAIHNDLAPRPGRETWSFGPALSEHVRGRYVELDLVVPELVGDSDAWRALPWHEHHRANPSTDRVTLYRIHPGSYAMIFAPTP